MESINFVSPNIGMNNYEKQMMDDGLCSSNQRDNSSLYSFPGILHYLQAEWNKMESERAHWEIEKAELMAKIAFLQGEKKGQESLKEDLVRRIKMLEYALKQKNQTITDLKYGVGMSNNGTAATGENSKNNANEVKNEATPKLQTDLEKAKAVSSEWRESRQRLRRFLQEVGFVDSMLDMRQFRLRSMLSEGLFSKVLDESVIGKNPEESMLDAESSALKTFDFLGNEKDSNIKGDEYGMKNIETNHVDSKVNVEDDTNDWISQLSQRANAKRRSTVNQKPNISSNDTGNFWMKEFRKKLNYLSVIDEEGPSMIGKGKMKHPPKRFNKKDPELQEILAQLTDDKMKDEIEDDKKDQKPEVNQGNNMDHLGPNYGLGDLASITVANDSEGELDSNVGQKLPFNNSVSGTGSIQLLESTLAGFDSSFKSNNDNDKENRGVNLNRDEVDSSISSGSNNRPNWTNKYTLRGHFDSVRCLSFYKNETAILSGSDDGTIKVWNFNKALIAKKGASQEIEAVQTMRGHNGAVLCVHYFDHTKSDPSDITLPMAVSGGVDGSIRFWLLPNLEIDPYEKYESSQNELAIPSAHKNSIWKIGVLPTDNTVYSVCTTTVNIWKLADTASVSETDLETNVFKGKILACSLQKTYCISDMVKASGTLKDLGRITSATPLKCNPCQLAIGSSTGMVVLLDMSSESIAACIDLSQKDSKIINDVWNEQSINNLVSHPTLALVFCAHDDHVLRTVDFSSNSVVYSMVVHQDSVSSVDLEEYGIYLITGSHDGSLRVWDLEKRSCIQEMSCHRVKNNEAVNCVVFHPTQPYIASCGAEGIVKIYS